MKTRFLTTTRTRCIVISLTTLLVFSSYAIYAQQQGNGMGHGNATPEEHAKRQTEMMKENLSLTTAQVPKVEAINLKYAKKMQPVRDLADTAARRKAVQNLSKQKDGELKLVLTPEQFKSYLKQVEEMKARRREMQH